MVPLFKTFLDALFWKNHILLIIISGGKTSNSIQQILIKGPYKVHWLQRKLIIQEWNRSHGNEITKSFKKQKSLQICSEGWGGVTRCSLGFTDIKSGASPSLQGEPEICLEKGEQTHRFLKLPSPFPTWIFSSVMFSASSHYAGCLLISPSSKEKYKKW